MSRPSASTWPQERYAAGEELARLLRLANVDLQEAALPGVKPTLCDRIDAALSEYERVRDHP